jgi:predicted Fe-Mo cluster-binding NifX family protein
MKICVTSSGNTLESNLDPRFGRAIYFIIVDTNTMEFEVIENAAANSGGGAGITSGQFIVDKGIEAVITGNVGPNAANVLKAQDIKIYRGKSTSVKENIQSFNEGTLETIDTAGPSHFGMGR